MIEIKSAVKKYKKIRALDELNLTIEKGKITALLGINGVGKSTTLKAVMGLIKLNSGEILVDGKSVTYKSYNKVAFVADINNTYKGMTIQESFEYMKMFYKNWDMNKAYKMLKGFNLEDTRKINDLSKGNIARVKIILGFAQNPKYLLLDEPFSGIDVFTREAFISSLISYMDEDMAIVLTTHEIKDIESIVDDVILLNYGKVVEKFNVEKIREEEGLSILEKMREVYSKYDK